MEGGSSCICLALRKLDDWNGRVSTEYIRLPLATCDPAHSPYTYIESTWELHGDSFHRGTHCSKSFNQGATRVRSFLCPSGVYSTTIDIRTVPVGQVTFKYVYGGILSPWQTLCPITGVESGVTALDHTSVLLDQRMPPPDLVPALARAFAWIKNSPDAARHAMPKHVLPPPDSPCLGIDM